MEPKKGYYDPDSIAIRIARAERRKVEIMGRDNPLPGCGLTAEDKLYLHGIGIKA